MDAIETTGRRATRREMGLSLDEIVLSDSELCRRIRGAPAKCAVALDTGYDGQRDPLMRLLPILAVMGAVLCGSSVADSQVDALHARFDSLLAQLGVVGGGFALVHEASPATEYFLGEADGRTRKRVDAATSYNWA
jgi:hypothetical protein